jgi:hypothetical protein
MTLEPVQPGMAVVVVLLACCTCHGQWAWDQYDAKRCWEIGGRYPGGHFSFLGFLYFFCGIFISPCCWRYPQFATASNALGAASGDR